jgi:hypothetical protein
MSGECLYNLASPAQSVNPIKVTSVIDSWLDLLDRRGGFHCPQGPGALAAMASFRLAGLKWHPLAAGQSIPDQLKSLSPTAFDGNQEVGALLRKEEKIGRFPCRASACTSTSVSSMLLRSRWSAAVSLLSSVA